MAIGEVYTSTSFGATFRLKHHDDRASSLRKMHKTSTVPEPCRPSYQLSSFLRCFVLLFRLLATMSLISSCLFASTLLAARAVAFTGHEYQLTNEYSGANFFDGWDFYTVR